MELRKTQYLTVGLMGSLEKGAGKSPHGAA
jgi:hypothetical protein